MADLVYPRTSDRCRPKGPEVGGIRRRACRRIRWRVSTVLRPTRVRASRRVYFGSRSAVHRQNFSTSWTIATGTVGRPREIARYSSHRGWVARRQAPFAGGTLTRTAVHQLAHRLL